MEEERQLGDLKAAAIGFSLANFIIFKFVFVVVFVIANFFIGIKGLVKSVTDFKREQDDLSTTCLLYTSDAADE